MNIIMKISVISLSILVLSLLNPAVAQTKLMRINSESAMPAKKSAFGWTSNVKMTSATEGEIIIKVSIADGWHLYGTNLPKGGPKPTAFDFSGSRGIKLTGVIKASASPTEKFDSMFNLKLSYWTGTVTFRQKFKVTNAANASVAGTVTYMGCNDNTCSPPAKYTFSKAVKKIN